MMIFCRRTFRLAVLTLTAIACMGFESCIPEDFGSVFFHFRAPAYRQLSEVGVLDVRLRVPFFGRLENLEVTLQQESGALSPIPVSVDRRGFASGSAEVLEPGRYRLSAEVDVRFLFFIVGHLSAATQFQTVALENSDECEVLNSASCMLPYPSSDFFERDSSSPTGRRLAITAAMLPTVRGEPLDPGRYAHLDGASPTVQILMHFPGGVDIEASNASRLLPPGPAAVSPPYIDTRTVDGRSLEPDSPTLLIRASTGEQILHFVELDARAEGRPARQAMVMRPGESLIPGERYIVAVRGLVHPGGAPIEPEATFQALRDLLPTTIDGLRKRRRHFERKIFKKLYRLGIARRDLQLAFDFTVQSEQALTADMLDMRDQSFGWLADQIALGRQTFDVTSVQENDCDVAGETTWRIVRGTFDVPLFLSADPERNAMEVGFLNHGVDGRPQASGVTQPPFTISLPCSVLDPAGPLANPVVIGHGLFGRGEDMVTGFVSELDFAYIAGATNWRGLSGDTDPQGKDDFDFVLFKLVLGPGSTSLLNNMPALPDRLRQGQLDTLVLARMMKTAAFNLDPAFQTPDGRGAFPGVSEEMFYYGISLGGIMGTMFSALTPDIERLHVDVPAMNFGFLMQRSTQFGSFEIPLGMIGLVDPMERLLGLGLIHELWVTGEPAGYARHVTGLAADPLPGTNAKKILMTVAWLDKQVSNQASEVLARTLGIPNLDASIQQGLQGIPDLSGPLDSALVIYHAGSLDIFDPAHQPFIPPLANLIPSSKCDPHAARLTIPAALDQMFAFLQPGGRVENFCDGLCDAAIDYERPGGLAQVCDPLN